MTAITPAQAKLERTKTSPPADVVIDDIHRMRRKGIKDGTWPAWAEPEIRATAADATAKRRHGYPISPADLRAQQTVAAYNDRDRGHTTTATATSIPSMFRVHGPKVTDPIACLVCGDARSTHSGERCALCGDPVEHHDRDLVTGETAARFDDCLAGRIRMATARHTAGVPLDRIDQLALAHAHPNAGAA